jgi:hypothetical protein
VRAVRAVLAVVKALSPNAQNRCSVYQNGLLQTKKLGSLFRNGRKVPRQPFHFPQRSLASRLRSLGCRRWLLQFPPPLRTFPRRPLRFAPPSLGFLLLSLLFRKRRAIPIRQGAGCRHGRRCLACHSPTWSALLSPFNAVARAGIHTRAEQFWEAERRMEDGSGWANRPTTFRSLGRARLGQRSTIVLPSAH